MWAEDHEVELICERPAEAADRRVLGHLESDLIIGLGRSAIGNLVERTTRYTMLAQLPRDQGYGITPRPKNGPALAGYGAITMKNLLSNAITTLPDQLIRSLTRDRGKELSAHAQFTLETASRCSSPTRSHPGNAARTRRRAGCCENTSPGAPV